VKFVSLGPRQPSQDSFTHAITERDEHRWMVSELRRFATNEQWAAVEKRAKKINLDQAERKRLERFRSKACAWAWENDWNVKDRKVMVSQMTNLAAHYGRGTYMAQDFSLN
jgi:hypothetical protein